ncbi:CDP-alcohol phosphatidyltransferase family protein [Motilibacter deserti]|uniref:CDP-alcohol phosphatidyltransferase family protein n=1 Tax=Motilibacter deserti TaxID=2714956 RepID=A0ABX0GWV3_9ACTN|nr:CDP-alcohol phosphatidyltransferase family protein [Motilibacter deserti]NHC14274.1 CDP-alcohol phosphatidyltransferase family protein [Motilibacter deserti]
MAPLPVPEDAAPPDSAQQDSAQQDSEPQDTDRVLTVPNLLSLARLLGVPLFLWLILAEHDGWALAVLAFSGVSDWLDGKLARLLGQTSRLGALLDPAADRLYILATLVGLTIRDVIPLWLTVALVARDLFTSGLLLVLRRHGHGVIAVHFLGKAATANLLYAFPLLLLGDGTGRIATAANVVGWAFACWGVVLYWWAAVLYAVQVRRAVAGAGAGRRSGAPRAEGGLRR